MLLAHVYLFDSKEIHTVNVRMNENSLSEQNHFKWDDTSFAKISYQKGTWHGIVQLTWGSPDFKKSLKVQLTWGSPVKISRNLSKCRLTMGKSPSPLLGALNVNPNKGLHTVEHFLEKP